MWWCRQLFSFLHLDKDALILGSSRTETEIKAGLSLNNEIGEGEGKLAFKIWKLWYGGLQQIKDMVVELKLTPRAKIKWRHGSRICKFPRKGMLWHPSTVLAFSLSPLLPILQSLVFFSFCKFTKLLWLLARTHSSLLFSCLGWKSNSANLHDLLETWSLYLHIWLVTDPYSVMKN